MSSAIETLMRMLSRDALERLAGGRSFDRGEDYWLSGNVRSVVQDGGTVIAKVAGTDSYRVELWVEDGELEYTCTCPVNDDGSFCKHCVAVGLKLLADKQSPHTKTKQAGVTMDDIRVYLRDMEKDSLVEMVIKQAKDDDQLRDRLLMKAARRRGNGIELTAFTDALRNAVDAGDYVPYKEMYSYAQGIHRVIDSIEELLEEDHASEVITLTELALEMVEQASYSLDDSSGNMGELLCRLQDIHFSACEQSPPDPEELAGRLFERELASQCDVFYGAAETYVDILGDKGLAVYKRLAEAEWAKIVPLSPSQKDDDKYGRRFRITSMMETLASHTGDIELQVAIMSRDLSMAHDFLQIAEIYKSKGFPDKALEWAEKGAAAFPEKTDSRLREFLADEYHRRKRHDDAIALIWAQFRESPMLDHYQNLKTHGDKAEQWAIWRDKAIQLLRDEMEKEKRERKTNRSWYFQPDASELVRIFLWEKNAEDAWETAKQGGCHDKLWLDLAGIREKDHPEDAIAVYKPRVEPTIDHGNYETAVAFLGKIRKLMHALGREREFADYLQYIRITWKRKRNLMKLLDTKGWE